MVDPRQSIHQEPTWLLVGRGCQALGQPSRWTTVTPGAREPQPPQLSWLVGKEIWHHCFPASEVCDFLGVGRFSSPDHHLCWGKEPSKLPGLPATRQTLGIFLENWSSILSQSCWYFKFLFQVGTNPNSGFGHFCLKQRIFLCMVPVVIMYDKILWILFRHLCLCICDFPILIKSNIFGIAHKKAIHCKYVYNFFNYLEDFKEIPFCFEMSYSSITWENGFKRKGAGSEKVSLYCEAKRTIVKEEPFQKLNCM